MIRMDLDRKKEIISVNEPESISSLQNGHYGSMKKGIIYLKPEEVLYIMDIRNGKVYDESGNVYTFNDVAAQFMKIEKLLARYLTYKDWRDKGLILRYMDEANGNYNRIHPKKYTHSEFKLDSYGFDGLFFPDDLQTIVDDETVGKDLYEKHWLGQFGTYKSAHRGKIAKLDVYETIFLLKHGSLKLKNKDLTVDDILDRAEDRIKYFSDMYAVYEDWRLRGYVIKTGFKFGTHFRLYFPGASPIREGDEWMHSRHVIHVFSRKSKMLISEWARAIRVAHSVKKTFILAIPGKKLDIKVSNKKPRVDFLLYHRKKDGIENPKDDKPKYLMLSLTEDEYIGGEGLAEALFESRHYGLELIMAISDRESSVTYYAIKKIDLPKSEYEYFEIEWIQP